MKRKPAESVGSSIRSISLAVKAVLGIRSLGRVLLALSHQYSSTMSVGDGRRNGYPHMQGTCTNTKQTSVAYWQMITAIYILTQFYLPNVCISILKKNAVSAAGQLSQPNWNVTVAVFV